jgi:UDP-N-acetylglucosamine:LPS N-acetylglucosamine transferase
MVNELFSDDARLRAMAASARTLANPDAAGEICRVIETWGR